jgi:glycosyltransferase involved in cell wall biosynthesis
MERNENGQAGRIKTGEGFFGLWSPAPAFRRHRELRMSNLDEPLTIVLISDSAQNTGGQTKVAFDSAIGLKQAGHRPIIFAATGPVDQRLVEAGVETICLGQYDILSNPSAREAAVQGIWNRKAADELGRLLAGLPRASTVIHMHGWAKAISPAVAGPIRASGLPAVYTMHEYFLFCPNGGFYNYRDQHVCALEPLSARCIATNCDSRSYAHKAWRLARQAAAKYLFRLQGAFSDIVYITRFQVDAVGRLHPEGARMHLVSNPISSENLGPKPQPASGEIIYVGRLSPEKGVLLFAEAARRAKLTPIFVGDGPMRAELAAAYPEARIQGWVKPEEARAAMRAARAMVFPSQWWEAQGLTALEAKAFGTPVIVADQCAAREEVEDGVTGLWFRTGDIDHLTAALHKMQDDAAVERMSLAAYQAFWAEPRGLERHVEIIVGVYRDMLARSQRGGRS